MWSQFVSVPDVMMMISYNHFGIKVFRSDVWWRCLTAAIIDYSEGVNGCFMAVMGRQKSGRVENQRGSVLTV